MIQYIISACLVGLDTRYDGKNSFSKVFFDMVKEGKAVPFCPEQAGGLTTPRLPSEISGGDGNAVLMGKAKVISKDGQDVTDSFIKGAKQVLKFAELLGVKKAILKSKSPSCGCEKVYDRSFCGILRDGMGVTAAYLKDNGIEVIDSEEFLSSGCYKMSE